VTELPTLGPAKYGAEVYLTRAPDYGRLRIGLEAAEKPIDFDGYAPRVERADKLRVGEMLPHDGRLLLDVRVIGRHRRYRGHLAGIDRIVLVPLAAPAARWVRIRRTGALHAVATACVALASMPSAKKSSQRSQSPCSRTSFRSS
jgi:hypothetical protein